MRSRCGQLPFNSSHPVVDVTEGSFARTIMRLPNEVAIVTGAGRGIGNEIARRFAAEGAGVVVADLDEPSASRAACEINAAGGKALALHADISEPQQVERLIGETIARFGRLDIVVNNAGIGL